MRIFIFVILLFVSNVSIGAETTTCNKFGGHKNNAWWAYQTCDYITKKAITPMLATQRAKSELYSEYYVIYVTTNSIVIKDSNPGMHAPLVTEVILVIDDNEPYAADLFNYGFYPIVNSPIREAHIKTEDYNSFISELKSGKELRVLWKQNSFPDSYKYIFSLEDAKESILHLEKHKMAGIKSSKKTNEYRCKVKELSGISEIETEEHNISNGPVDGDTYSIVINENTLSFTNTSNNTTAQMNYNPATTAFEDSWYSFNFNNNDHTFIFGVNKPNYSVNYIGECLEQ